MRSRGAVRLPPVRVATYIVNTMRADRSLNESVRLHCFIEIELNGTDCREIAREVGVAPEQGGRGNDRAGTVGSTTARRRATEAKARARSGCKGLRRRQGSSGNVRGTDFRRGRIA